MKKLFLFFALLAGVAVMTGCQKDLDGVTLTAIIDHDTKAYFGNDARSLPYWDADDSVFLAGQNFSGPCTLNKNSVSTTFATITAPNSSDVYGAIFPFKAVEKMGTPNTSATKATIYFHPSQKYIWDNTNKRQRLEMPMGAVTTNTDKTLIFKNLGSVIRINVVNKLDTTVDVHRLTVQAFGGYVAGHVDVTLSKDNDPVIETDHLNNINQYNVLSVYNASHMTMGSIDKDDSMSFDVVVPPFEAAYLILEAELYKHKANSTTYTPYGYTSDTVGNPRATTREITVTRNKIIPVRLKVNTAIGYDYAYLKSGPEMNHIFDSIIAKNPGINDISFNRQTGIFYQENTKIDSTDLNPTTPAGWTEVQAMNSPRKIYAYVDATGTVLHINSWATLIYADTNCSGMFQDLTNLTAIHWNTTHEFGFQSEDVTDMSYLFAGCSAITTPAGIENFNTTNVLNMSHMFEDCSLMKSLDLTYFNTHNLKDTGMVSMFKGCSGLQTLDLSSFNTERITSMKEVFMNCNIMDSLAINGNGFVIPEGTVLTNMCTGLNTSRNQWNKGRIYCTEAIRRKLLSKDANDNYITGIDPIHVYFPLQGETAK